jgi:hypothetical protein
MSIVVLRCGSGVVEMDMASTIKLEFFLPVFFI